MALWFGSEVGVIAFVLLVGYLIARGVEREWVGAPDEPALSAHRRVAAWLRSRVRRRCPPA